MFGVPSDIKRELQNSYYYEQKYFQEYSVSNNTTLDDISRFNPSTQRQMGSKRYKSVQP